MYHGYTGANEWYECHAHGDYCNMTKVCRGLGWKHGTTMECTQLSYRNGRPYCMSKANLHRV